MKIDKRTGEFLEPREAELFGRYAAIIRRLRAPDGCPWDRAQTLPSLRRFIVEEAFEVLAAINEKESGKASLQDIAEELGDVLLVTMLLADALVQAGGPSFSDILRENGEKLIRRHPHVFGDVIVRDEHDVKRNWDEIKETVEKKVDGVSATGPGLPPLERAFEIQKRAARLGFDWSDEDPVYEKIVEETRELKAEVQNAREKNIPLRDNLPVESELGDLLFSVVNLARKLKTDPSVAMAGANERFLSRFAHIEKRLQEQKKTVADTSLNELDELWEEAKRAKRGGS
ncbi:MAG: nucleoside triphosphate pyrophosphohydrolase [Spirochaetaceae bacterium]|nr:MAG: nucleoside triphosphate pyrophosphohydrolase [Spirochaetaceae bacterium]